jgi:hypothetical protein
MKNIILILLVLAMAFGCTEQADETIPETQGALANDSNPAENDSAAEPEEDETVAHSSPTEEGETTLEVTFTGVDLTETTQEVRKPNPECYPDAQKCMMEEMPMHIFEEVEHKFYNLSSTDDICLITMSDIGSDSLYLVEYSIENQDSESHTVSPEVLVKTENTKMGYLVSTPYSKTNCTGFYDDSDLDIELAPSESMDFKALIIIPSNETPLSASVYVDGD